MVVGPLRGPGAQICGVILKLSDGIEFSVSTGVDLNRIPAAGTLATFKYYSYSSNGVPVCPVYMRQCPHPYEGE